jgi:hypothetical protein
MTNEERENQFKRKSRLIEFGISRDDIKSLHRISNTLRNWFELECGFNTPNGGSGAIERDELTEQPFMRTWDNQNGKRKWSIRDRETGARKRLDKIMSNYPDLVSYVQRDPRGCAVYILQTSQLDGSWMNPWPEISSIYTNGIAIF